MRVAVKDVLKELGVHPDCIDAGGLAGEIVRHMEAGLGGAEGSMMMIPTYMYAEGEIVQGEPVAVIDAGGTNLRAASVVFGPEGAEVLRLEKSRMPGTEGKRITAREMYAEFAERILPMMPESGKIALCFSYAFKAMPDGEAEIITMGKEVDIADAEGSHVAAGLRKALKEAGFPGEPAITVLNDTAAVLYSAVASGHRSAAGLILGTGLNIAYFEDTAAIKKIGPVGHSHMAVNTEAAYFSAVPAGIADMSVDADSRNPGRALLEKMVSGAYLGQIAVKCVPLLAEKGILSESCAEACGDTPFRVQDMSELIAEGDGPCRELCSGEDDVKVLSELFRAVEERAGKMAAALAAAVIKKMDTEKGTAVPLAVNGSTLLLNSSIYEEFTSVLAGLLGGRDRFRIMTGENDTIAGSAAAAFLG